MSRETNLATQNMCNSHFIIIHNRCEVVSREEVCFEKDWVGGEPCMRIFHRPKDEVSDLFASWCTFFLRPQI